MVCEWGMSEKLGPLAWEKREGQPFLGMQQSQGTHYSEAKAEEIDAEIMSIINRNYDRAKKILLDNMDLLNRLTEGLSGA